MTEQLVSILSVQQCALCIVGRVSYMSVAAVSQQVHCIMWLYQHKLIKMIGSLIMLGSDCKSLCIRVASNNIPGTMSQNVSLLYFHSDTLSIHFFTSLFTVSINTFLWVNCQSAFYII